MYIQYVINNEQTEIVLCHSEGCCWWRGRRNWATGCEKEVEWRWATVRQMDWLWEIRSDCERDWWGDSERWGAWRGGVTVWWSDCKRDELAVGDTKWLWERLMEWESLMGDFGRCGMSEWERWGDCGRDWERWSDRGRYGVTERDGGDWETDGMTGRDGQVGWLWEIWGDCGTDGMTERDGVTRSDGVTVREMGWLWDWWSDCERYGTDGVTVREVEWPWGMEWLGGGGGWREAGCPEPTFPFGWGGGGGGGRGRHFNGKRTPGWELLLPLSGTLSLLTKPQQTAVFRGCLYMPLSNFTESQTKTDPQQMAVFRGHLFVTFKLHWITNQNWPSNPSSGNLPKQPPNVEETNQQPLLVWQQCTNTFRLNCNSATIQKQH